MKIILRSEYRAYSSACKFFNTETLENRRTKICHKYATKNLKSENTYFTKLKPSMNTRNKSDIVANFKCNFGRFSKSSLPYLARLLNSYQTWAILVTCKHQNTIETCNLWTMGAGPDTWFWSQIVGHKCVMLCFLPLVDSPKINKYQVNLL